MSYPGKGLSGRTSSVGYSWGADCGCNGGSAGDGCFFCLNIGAVMESLEIFGTMERVTMRTNYTMSVF